MVQNKAKDSAPKLVIVESPAKAKTIGKYLGSDFIVEASVGHIRDLATTPSQLPEKYRKAPWARLAVNVDSNFEPFYVVSEDKVKQVSKLKQQLKASSALYLATDEDREGEAISWHLLEILKPQVPVHRLVFHEITKSAILKALETTRGLDMDLVEAQEARRILDRLYGYELSPVLWRKIKNRLSGGRVQSVAVKLIVERELERIRFHSANYWDVLGEFSSEEKGDFKATLTTVGEKAIPTGKDFDQATGTLKTPEKFILLDEQGAAELIERLRQNGAVVKSVEEKPSSTRPYPPFTTSTLQQEANRRLHFSARQTMDVAQRLYESGRITYMRTDSTTLSNEALNAARELVKTHYGEKYLPKEPRRYATTVKNAQEAHEAIRPSGNSFPLPETLRNVVSFDEYRLYDLIWKRTVACQMTNSIEMHKTIVVSLDDACFQVSGKTIEFPGFRRAYVEGKDDPEAELADQETLLPDLKPGDVLQTKTLTPQDHTTVPPARYTEASLTRTLVDKGVGRPSTYATIIDVILNRDYGFKRNNALIPTWTAFAIYNLLQKYFPELVDYDFTASMDQALDDVSTGTRDRNEYLRAFYFGDVEDHSQPGSNPFPFPDSFASGLKQAIDSRKDEINPRDISAFLVGTPVKEDGTPDEPIYVRVGRYGPFLEQGDVQTHLPDQLAPDELTITKALEFINSSKLANSPIGTCPDTGKPIYLRHGRFGWYVQRGDAESGDEKPQNVSLLKGMTEHDVTLEVALQLLNLPKTLGVDPATELPVMAYNGRYGAYVKRGEDSRTLPAGMSLLTVTLEQALELLAKEKFPSRAKAKKQEPLKTFGPSPVTGQEVKLMDGRYGLYVTDGETNASLTKELDQESIDLEKALELLAARAARGTTSRKKSSRKTTVKKTTKKTTTKKATTKKKAVKKTATVKKSAPPKAAPVVDSSTEDTPPF